MCSLVRCIVDDHIADGVVDVGDSVGGCGCCVDGVDDVGDGVGIGFDVVVIGVDVIDTGD